jgi:hypothetical protein
MIENNFVTKLDDEITHPDHDLTISDRWVVR